MRRFFRLVFWFIIVVVVVVIGFRLDAYEREVESREFHLPQLGKVIQTSLGDVYIEEEGFVNGTPVLLVHGSVGWSRFWHETTYALGKAGYRAIAMDLSPMGYSERSADGDYSRVMQANRIVALAEAMKIKPVLVAHSFGAGPGTEAIMRAPDRFQSYVIVDGAIGVGSHLSGKTLPALLRPQWVREFAVALTVTNRLALKPLLQMFLHKKGAATPEYLDLLKQPMALEGTTPELAKWLPTLLVPPQDALSTRPEAYAKIDLPVGIIWGAEDTATPVAQGEELNQLISGSRLIVLEGLGHIPQIEDAPAFQKALLDLLDDF
ncbi:MAG: alpha/beta hydrolase [Pseudomonadota bacterium]